MVKEGISFIKKHAHPNRPAQASLCGRCDIFLSSRLESCDLRGQSLRRSPGNDFSDDAQQSPSLLSLEGLK